MNTQPIICIVTDAARLDADLVFAAWGSGPTTFVRRLTDDPAPTTSSTVTHWLMSNAGASVEYVAIVQAMAHGDLPPLSDGKVWGVDGVIDAASAVAAVNGSELQCYSASGEVTPLDLAMAVLASRGLSFVPDEL